MNSGTNSVLVGMFDDQAAARSARDKLMASGFDASAVTMTDDAGADGAGMATSSAATTSGTTAGTRAEPEEGAISRFFHSIFGDDENDDRTYYGNTYEEAVRRGHYGVSVSARSDDEMDRAEDILNDCGAIDVDERSQQWRSEGWSGGTGSTNPLGGTAGAAVTGDDTRTINVVEEDLKVGKRAVARGGVRVFSRVREVPVEETVHLREEHANVQRREVDRPATEADFAAFKDGSIEVREMSEEAVVSKDARVVGEVEVSKTVDEHDETVRDTVRKTEVDVEDIEPKAKGSKTYTKP